MSVAFLDTMRRGLTPAYSRGLERLRLVFGATAADGTTTIQPYDFHTYQNLYDGVLPASPRYLVTPLLPTGDPLIVRVWFKRDANRPEDPPVDVEVPAEWPGGRGIAIPVPGPAAAVTSQLRLTRFQPQPPASQLSQSWEIVALLGTLAKLLWAVGVEHEELARQLSDVASQRSAGSAHGASLDLLGQDLAVPRFPPTPYTWDPDTLALYHLDDLPVPPQPEVTKVLDDRSRYQATSHPGQNNGGHSGKVGRFSGAFEFSDDNTSISIPDDPEFALPAGATFTVEAIIKPDPTRTATGAVIAKRAQLNAASAAGWALAIGSYRGVDRNVRFSLSDGTREVELFADIDLGDGTFHHVAGAVDHRPGPPAVTLALLYLDGVEVARQPLGAIGSMTSADPIVIGFGRESVANAPTDAQYLGLVDEVRISKVARTSFHPVVGEGDDEYRRRLGIFQSWLLPTPEALETALNRLAGPVANDARPFVVDEKVDPMVIGTLPMRVLPAPLRPGGCISAAGDERSTEAAAAGVPEDEPDFDQAWLRRHEDRAGLSFGTVESNRLMQWSVQLALDAMLDRLAGVAGTLTVVKAYDPAASGLHKLGRAIALIHDQVAPGDLAVLAHAAGFAWVCHTGTGKVYASQATADVFRITPSDSGRRPQPPDVVEGQDLDLDLDPSPTGFADAQVRWSLIHCGHGNGTLATGRPAKLHALSAGDISVRAEVTRRRHTGVGSRTVRIGLPDGGLAAGQSIGGNGLRGVTESEVAGGPSDDFNELYLATRTDDFTGQRTNVDYGAGFGNRRMQRAASTALDRLLDLIAAAPGKLSVVRAYDPAGPGLLQQGRALWLRHSQLAAGPLAARAFAAGFDFVRIDPGPPPTVQVAVAGAEQIEVIGPPEVQVGNSVQITVEPQAGPAAVCFSADGTRAYIADHSNHLVTALTVSASTPASFPVIALDRAGAVAATPAAVAFAGSQVYVAHDLPGKISVLDPVTLALSVSVPTGPRATTIAADGNRVFVGCTGDSSLRAYDTQSHQEVGKLVLPGVPLSIAPVPGGTSLYVVIAGDRFCQVNRANLQLTGAPIATGAGASSGLVTPDGKKLYIACSADAPQTSTGTVHVYSTSNNQQTKVVAGFPPGTPPAVLSIGADQKYLFVTTSATSPAVGRVHAVLTSSDTLLPQLFTPSGTSRALSTSPAGAAYAPCLLAVSADAAAVTLGDPAPLNLPQPDPPRVGTTVGLGSGAGEHLAWSTVPFSRGRVELASLVKPVDHAVGLAPGATLVRAMYISGDHLRPYQFEVRLNPSLDAQPAVTIRKDQYDLVMNILNSFHPLGVEVLTGRLRARVVELGELGADLFPSYTYPVFHNRGLSLPPPTNPVEV